MRTWTRTQREDTQTENNYRYDCIVRVIHSDGAEYLNYLFPPSQVNYKMLQSEESVFLLPFHLKSFLLRCEQRFIPQLDEKCARCTPAWCIPKRREPKAQAYQDIAPVVNSQEPDHWGSFNVGQSVRRVDGVLLDEYPEAVRRLKNGSKSEA